MGDLVDQPLEQILDEPEVQHVFDDIKLGVAVPTPPVLIVQAVHDQLISVGDIDELADTYSCRRRRTSPITATCSASTCCCTRCRRRWHAALADQPVRRTPLTAHLVRTKWPTLLNPMTYMGMARLAEIAAKVAL